MLKIVVFDSGYGGELLADWLEEELPVLEIIRVIDWRNADKIFHSAREARKVAESTLAPYIGTVDLIVFANYLLTTTSLKYFQHKYKNQKFTGLNLESPDTFIKRDVLVLATKAITKTINYRNFIIRIKRKTKTLVLDSWPNLIDDGELTDVDIKNALELFLIKEEIIPEEIVLACAQFVDIKNVIKNILGQNIRIYDGYKILLRNIYKTLGLRGGIVKRK